MLQLNVQYDFEYVTCARCGAPIVMEKHVMKERRRTHQSFYCVQGHKQSFNDETEAQKLQKQLDNERKHHQWTRNDLAQEKRHHTATKGNVTKLKNRAANGVCPCCKRTFENLARHMQTKHPNFTKRGTDAGTKEKKKADKKADTDSA